MGRAVMAKRVGHVVDAEGGTRIGDAVEECGTGVRRDFDVGDALDAEEDVSPVHCVPGGFGK